MLLNQRQLATLNSQKYKIQSSHQQITGYHVPNRFSQTQVNFSQNILQTRSNQFLTNPQIQQLTSVLIKYFGREYAYLVNNYNALYAAISRQSFDIDGFVAQFYAKSGIMDPDILKVMQNISGSQNTKYKQMELMRLFLMNKFLINSQIAQVINNISSNNNFNPEQLPEDKKSVLKAKIDILMNQVTHQILNKNNLISEKITEQQLEKTFAQIKSRYLEKTNQQTQPQIKTQLTQKDQEVYQQNYDYFASQTQTQVLTEKLHQLLNKDIITLIAELNQREHQTQVINKTELYIQKIQSYKLDSQIQGDKHLSNLDISSIRKISDKNKTVSVAGSADRSISKKQQRSNSQKNVISETDSATYEINSSDNIPIVQNRQEFIKNDQQQKIMPQIYEEKKKEYIKSRPISKTEYIDFSSEDHNIPSLTIKTSSSIEYSSKESKRRHDPFKKINYLQTEHDNNNIQLKGINTNNNYSQYISFYHQMLKNNQYVPLPFKMFKSIYSVDELRQIMYNQSTYGHKEKLYSNENVQHIMETLQLHLQKQKDPINKIQGQVQKALSLGRANTIFINTILQQKLNYMLSLFKEECDKNPYNAGKTIYQDKIRNVNWLYNMQDNITQNSIQTFVLVTQLMQLFVKQNSELVTNDMISLSQQLESNNTKYHLVQIVKTVQTETIGIAQFQIVLQATGKEYTISTGVRGFKVNYIVTSDKILDNSQYLQFYYNETVIHLKFDLEKLDIITELKKIVGINDYIVTLQNISPRSGFQYEEVSIHDLYKTKSYDSILPIQIKYLQNDNYIEQIECFWPFYHFQLKQLQNIYELNYASQVKTQRYILIYSAYKAICNMVHQYKEPLTLEQMICFVDVPEEDINIIYSLLCFYFS